jgi:hypothetical protein
MKKFDILKLMSFIFTSWWRIAQARATWISTRLEIAQMFVSLERASFFC